MLYAAVLVAPSDELWTRGAAAFGELPTCSEDLGGERGKADPTQALREKTAELAARAPKTTDPEARAVLYGELLGTCARCHDAGC